MKKIANLILSVAILTLLPQCATPYKSLGRSGGFSDLQTDANIFEVQFSGNAYTKPEMVIDYCLLRSAEVCKARGYDYFTLTNSEWVITNVESIGPANSSSTLSVAAYGTTGNIHGTANTTGGQVTSFQKPALKNTIVCKNGEPSGEGVNYDADQVISDLRKKYRLKN